MIKKLLLLITLFFSIYSFSQNKIKYKKPNYKSIKKQTLNENSEFYYEKLLKKFNDKDAELSLKEKRHFYYGYRYQDAYSPNFGKDVFTDSIYTILNKEKLVQEDYKKIVELADKVLEKDIINLNVYNYQLYFLEQLNNEGDKYKLRSKQFKTLVGAILSSGSGRKLKDPFYVLLISHEYYILNMLGYEFGGTQQLIKKCDFLKVQENEDGIKGFYFDISPSLDYSNDLFKE
ncbi:DUF4919 domain-containing protein [Aureivirga sp. CE67]|uniref:DUF4919 domain-containing protein n=1 Tax=Aureivirga sp. CE67 TaxID=1788983 RepID=UPI0018CB66AA|nr:DUF4919 domain-containing protein [Aureivirga sp. CE67]